MDAPWSELPPDILESVASKLTTHKDYIRFRAVCISWRSNVPARPRYIPCQPPWLMLPSSQTPLPGNNNTNLRTFFNLSDNKFHQLDLPQTRQRRCCGSSNGWLILLDETPVIYAFNPLSRKQFTLPPLTTFPKVVEFDVYKVGKEYLLQNQVSGARYWRDLKAMRDLFIKKIGLSTSPLDDEYTAVAILGETGEMAFCKKGGQSWSMIDGARSFSEDVVYHDGLFYAVSKKGAVAVIDLSGDSPMVAVIPPPPVTGVGAGDEIYLVVSQGELFLVYRYLNLVGNIEPNLIYMTDGFDVMKCDTSDLNWTPVKNLGDRMFFLGGNSSLCLSASDFEGCQGNRIYFTDDYTEANDDSARGYHDVGVFRLEDGGIDALPCWSGHARLLWPPHFWVTLSPY